ncbi:MAG: flagellar basal body P-ring formation chaperone FlgA, partial [Armatimonadota bacterium]|nr:flagellar basal body P-ring formation chaperone FlgA [Armatimonadota bacterium]
QRPTRAASAGAILTTDWIEPIPAVRRREFITIVARVGAVRATTRVLALADGGVGDIIRVRTDGRKQEFLARVSGPGRAEVILSP